MSNGSSGSFSFREKALLNGSSLNLVRPTSDSPYKNSFCLWVIIINWSFLSKYLIYYLIEFFWWVWWIFLYCLHQGKHLFHQESGKGLSKLKQWSIEGQDWLLIFILLKVDQGRRQIAWLVEWVYNRVLYHREKISFIGRFILFLKCFIWQWVFSKLVVDWV